MLDCGRMTAPKLRFPTPDEPDLLLDIGVHGVAPRDGGQALAPVEDGVEPSVRFCVDRRGVWLTVGDGVQGVHVNGRPIRRMAMLRTGDAIYVDGQELRLVSSVPLAARAAEAAGEDAFGAGDVDLRIVLRGVGGRHHGRSFTLDQPRLVGRHPDADIRIDDPGFPDRLARLERAGHGVRLVDLGAGDYSSVNGEPVRDALLQAGDQLVFDAHHRFVVEAPARSARDTVFESDDEALPGSPTESARPRAGLPLPWLLLAAVMIAGLLSVLLLYGAA